MRPHFRIGPNILRLSSRSILNKRAFNNGIISNIEKDKIYRLNEGGIDDTKLNSINITDHPTSRESSRPISTLTPTKSQFTSSSTHALPTLHRKLINKTNQLLSQKSLSDCKNIPYSTYKTIIEPLLLEIRYSQHDFDLILTLYGNGYSETAYKLQAILACHWSASLDVKLTLVTSLALIISRGEVEWSNNFLNLLFERFNEDDYRSFIRSLKNTIDGNDPEKNNAFMNNYNSSNSPATSTNHPLTPLQFKYNMANALVKFSLDLGLPLLTSSLLIQFRSDSIYIQTNLIFNCIQALLVYDPKLNPFHIRAIYNIYCAYPNDRIVLNHEMKRKLITNGIHYSKDKHPSFANECFNLAMKLNGDPVPIISAYKMILLNLQHNNISQASNIWKSISKSLGDIDNHDRVMISSLLMRLSKDRKYLKLALLIGKDLPIKYYNLEGITEGLILTCSRAKDLELIEKLYKNLSQPLRRTTLTSLLKLHLALDDSKGVEKILTEINSKKGSVLSGLELSSIIDELAYHDIKRAEIFLERFSSWPTEYLLRSYASIMNHAINKQDWPTYNKYMSLTMPYDNTRTLSTQCCIENIKIKAICNKNPITNTTFQSVQNLWQSFMTKDRKYYQKRERKIGLNIIADLALNLKTSSSSIIEWLILEYINLGLSHNDINQYLRSRYHFRSLPISIQEKWLSILAPYNDITKL